MTTFSRPFAIVACAAIGISAAGTVRSQQLTLNPTTASQSVTATVFNDTGSLLIAAVSYELAVLRHSGELAAELLVPGQVCDALTTSAPDQTTTIMFNAPAVDESYTIVCTPTGTDRAAARLDVWVPTANAQQIAFYPTGVSRPQVAHQVDFTNPTNTTWEFANVGGAAH